MVEDKYCNAHSDTTEPISLPTTTCLDVRADFIHSSPAIRSVSVLLGLDDWYLAMVPFATSVNNSPRTHDAATERCFEQRRWTSGRHYHQIDEKEVYERCQIQPPVPDGFDELVFTTTTTTITTNEDQGETTFGCPRGFEHS
jgi:hypothetical protein